MQQRTRHTPYVKVWDQVKLYSGTYNESILRRQATSDTQDPLLLVIGIKPNELIIRYPDSTTDVIHPDDVAMVVSPEDNLYWKEYTMAMQKQQFYNDAYNSICEQHGIIAAKRYGTQAIQQIAEPYYAEPQTQNHLRPSVAQSENITSPKLVAFNQMKAALDILIRLEEHK